MPAKTLDSADNETDECVSVRITVGAQNVALLAEMQKSPKKLFEDLWINDGEEVWISVSHPHRFAVYGTVWDGGHATSNA